MRDTQMPDELQALRQVLLAAGWTALEKPGTAQNAPLDLLVTRDYATLGIVLAGDADKVVSVWAECQLAMGALRRHDPPGRWKDYYLAFVVDMLTEESVRRVRNVLNDTEVCRKICIERRGRGIIEALGDAPALGIVPAVSGEGIGLVDVITEQQEIAPRILADLAKRSAEYILDMLLSGGYDQGNNEHEAQESPS